MILKKNAWKIDISQKMFIAIGYHDVPFIKQIG